MGPVSLFKTSSPGILEALGTSCQLTSSSPSGLRFRELPSLLRSAWIGEELFWNAGYQEEARLPVPAQQFHIIYHSQKELWRTGESGGQG